MSETIEPTEEACRLCLDVTAEHARALHRIVRSMHDGHCPKCGYLAPSEFFWHEDRHTCPICEFTVTEIEARVALKAFRPHLQASVELFEEWRKGLYGKTTD